VVRWLTVAASKWWAFWIWRRYRWDNLDAHEI
jgi:hypothetical protein